MSNLLWLVVVVLVIVWFVGTYGYGAQGLIHVLLILAIVLILLKVVRSPL